MNECCLCRRQLIYSTATQGVLLSIVSARTKGLPVPPSAMSKYSNHCEESDDKGDNDQPRAKRGKKYSKTELESESSDEGVNDQPKTKRGKKNHNNTDPPSSGDKDTNQPQVMIWSDEESADERKWLPEFLLSGDEKLIESGNWLTDRHIIYSHTDDTEDFPCVDGLQVTLLAETGGWNILVQEGVQILNDSNKY